MGRRFKAIKERMADLTSQILSSKIQMEEYEAAINNLTRENLKLRNSVDELSQQLEDKDEAYKNLEARLEDAVNDVRNQDLKIGLLEAEKERVEQYKTKLEAAEDIVDAVKWETKTLRDQLYRVGDLTSKLEEADSQVTDLEKEIDAACQRKVEMASEIQQSDRHMGRLQEELFSVQQVLTDLDDQNRDPWRKLEEAEDEALALGVQLEVVMTVADGKIQEMAKEDLRKELGLLHAQNGELVEQMNAMDLRKELGLLHAQNGKLVEQMNAMRDQLLQELHAMFQAAELVWKNQQEEESKLMKDHNEVPGKLKITETEEIQRRTDVMQMKEAVCTGVSNLGEGFQNLASVMEAKRIQFLTHVSECIEEVKLLRAVSERQLQERQQHRENEMQELMAKLQKKKQQIDLLKTQLANAKFINSLFDEDPNP